MLQSWKADQEAYFTKFCNDQSSTLNKLVSELAELKQQNQAIQKSNMEIEKSIAFINQQYDDMCKQIEALQKDKQTYRDSILNLESKLLWIFSAYLAPPALKFGTCPPWTTNLCLI